MQLKLQTPFILIHVIAIIFLLTGCATNSQLLDGQAEIKKELGEIKKLIKDLPAIPKRRRAKVFKPSDINIANSPFIGKSDAPVTIVEFTDYLCPFCKRFAVTTLPQLIKDYVDTGKVKLVMREFPLKSIHPQAEKLAQAALCAGDQGKYWEMHDQFFKGVKKTDVNDFSKEIASLNLNAKSFQSCLDSNKYAQKIDDDIKEGSKLGTRGTPSFYLGKTLEKNPSKIHATKVLQGAQGYMAFKTIIDSLLK